MYKLKFEVNMERQFRYLTYSILLFMWADIKGYIFASTQSTILKVVAFVFLFMWLKEVWKKKYSSNKFVEKEDKWSKFN